ncbi:MULTISPECIES: apolipoprotein N-acyltransferase [Catenuloplanes]|uniref:Apolipoprotein N-acyltransferase n=1 Tax=Catenuloplanes niger TaxID=587534 RepID=A0AAE3ZYY9_9ACTN|nr:apolipoprotein N-acyltransferase [Catenuloplanes niger]MDR7327411.1 apolipoprotein N-acyltransferase [Catenuloplanes niger]
MTVDITAPAPAETRARPARPRLTGRRLAVLWRVPVAVTGGVVMDLGFPGLGWWPLTLAGVALVLAAVDGVRFRAGAGLGLLAGLAFYLVHVSWSGLYLGPVPWFALSASQAASFAVGCGLIAVASRLTASVLPGRRGAFLLYPLLAAGLWVTREEVAARWPYNGFSWGRVGFSHSEGPLAPLLSWVGTSGLSFVLVAIAAAAFQIVRATVRARRVRVAAGHDADRAPADAPGRRRALPVPALAGWSLAVLALALVPIAHVPATGEITVAAVQGNGPAGYFTKKTRGDLLAAQELATAPLLGQDVDVVVWPEDGADLDPLRYPEGQTRIRQLTEAMDAPLVFGTITKRDGQYYNTSLAWEPGASAPSDHYDKKRPVPFGEYVPDRAFYAAIVPDLIGMVARDYVPGTREGVLEVSGMRLGSAICFDITADDVIADLPVRGAQVILAQSNNGDFGTTDESVQQLAIARVRAIETGRDVVNVSTVGTSAIIAADGSTIDRLPTFRAGAMVQTVTLRDGLTPATRLRVVLPVALAAASLLTLAALAALRMRRASR